MFPYDSTLLTILEAPPQSIADVLATMQAIDATTTDGDGLKWFNWLYFQVTQAVETRVNAGGFSDPAFLAELDIQFAQLYFQALKDCLSNQPLPDCWQALFARRSQAALTRIQFALAGINAHINHDLPIALVAAFHARNISPQHGTAQYADYSGLNSSLDSLIDKAKTTLNVRFLGDTLPEITGLEDTLAGWSMSAARDAAWNNAELLWHLQAEAWLTSALLGTLDGLTSVVGQGLLIPVPAFVS